MITQYCKVCGMTQPCALKKGTNDVVCTRCFFTMKIIKRDDKDEQNTECTE